MKLQEYRFLSGDGEDELYGCAWLPDGPVKGYIQILHDLYDHIERYMHLLQFFAEHGYAAFGHDLVGHGRSVYRNGPGQISARHIYRHFIEDAETMFYLVVKDAMPKKEQKKSYIHALIGFGFGSMLAKQYAIMTSNCNALILCGDYGFPSLYRKAMNIYAKECRKKADTEPAEKTEDYILSHYGIDNMDTFLEERVSKPREQKKLKRDACCQLSYSMQYMLNRITLCSLYMTEDWISQLPEYLPILFMSGYEDVFSNYTRELDVVIRKLNYAGAENIFYKYYEHKKHELLFEDAAANVMQDMLKLIRRLEEHSIERKE